MESENFEKCKYSEEENKRCYRKFKCNQCTIRDKYIIRMLVEETMTEKIEESTTGIPERYIGDNFYNFR